MKITSSGQFEYCRWHRSDRIEVLSNNISTVDPEHFFQNTMSGIRLQMLNGQLPDSCGSCAKMEKHQKVSGRQKQLLKTGIVLDNFSKTAQSSPYYQKFHDSWNRNGQTDLVPVDWQIDLGNYCNGACVFCSPNSSSKLAQEFKKLNLISKMPPLPWVDDPVLIDKMINLLSRTPNLAYLHFIGGETLITPAFKKILAKLIQANITDIAVGFTTNLMVWDDEINSLLTNFREIHLGVSVETLTPVNDYVRWPAKISSVKQNLDRWVSLAKQHKWLVSLRTTPTCLSISDLHTVYEYAWQHQIGIESCNFLWEPEHMRISVLPLHTRLDIAQRLEDQIKTHTKSTQAQLINVRDPGRVHEYISQDLASYVDYLRTAPDESYRLPDLVKYLKLLESNRHNSVLDYLPQHEQLFRSAGY